MKIEMDKDFRGNAYIVHNEEVLLSYSGGFADLANKIPNTLNTRFASASMGKTFVAVGILQLNLIVYNDLLKYLTNTNKCSVLWVCFLYPKFGNRKHCEGYH